MQTNALLALACAAALGKSEYLVSYPAGSPHAMFARACLCKAAGLPLVQFTWR